MNHLSSHAYAKSLMLLLENEKMKSQFLENLKELETIFASEKINSFFLSPAINIKDKKEILKKVLHFSDFHPLLLNFLSVLLDNKRWDQLSQVSQKLHQLERERQSFLVVQVESDFPLEEDVKKVLQEKFSAFFQKNVSIKEKKSKNWLGGIRIHAGGFVFDDTLVGHLKQMEQKVKRGVYVSKRD